ncbi:MAG: hypothetical protein CL484_10700 [Acidobacteria bacterium]|nr:hypothetical protein [Acidobacteriota bacterium]
MTKSPEPETGSVGASARDLRGWSLGGYPPWGTALAAVALGVALVALVTVDLGPVLRGRAEQAMADYLDREVSIGRVSVRLLPGQFLVEDLVISGLDPGDQPFLIAERITLSTTWSALFHGEFLAESVSMSNWKMVAESFPDGRQSFPAFVRQSRQEPRNENHETANSDMGEADRGRERRFVATLKYLNATAGEFLYQDHGSDWSVVVPNLELTITKVVDYRGHASFSGGIIQIRDFEPMSADLSTDFRLNGADVHLTRIDLVTDGASSRLEGDVDLANFPEMTYTLESEIDFTRMREIFFSNENFTASGQGSFNGTFHKFEGGYDLRGGFISEVAGINQFRFDELAGQLLWQRDRFEVRDVVSKPYDGQVWFDFTMAPLGEAAPGQGVLEVRYQGVEIPQLFQSMGVTGIRPVARVSGRNLLEWPLGQFASFRSEGTLQLEPLESVELATTQLPVGVSANVKGRAGRSPDLTTSTFPLGGGVNYVATDEWVELISGRVATPSTHVEFGGGTGWGVDSQIRFTVISSNWQESDRLMASVMTAVGASTKPFAVDGYGSLEGVMLGEMASPRIDANFVGQDLRAWNVEWGTGRGEFVVENSFLNVSSGVFGRGKVELQVDGRFSLATPRNDDLEEMNAVVKMVSFPAADIRSAFGLEEGYRIDGPATGEVHLYGSYRRLFGFGRLVINEPTAYGESFDLATADLLFEGNGVRLNSLSITKGRGSATGAAFIEWDASYSFNLDFQGVQIETLTLIPSLPQQPSGLLEGTSSGVGYFDDPRYVVRATIRDLFVGDEELGQMTGRLNVQQGDLRLDIEVASPVAAMSASGRVALLEPYDTDVSLRVVDSSLDPFLRMFVPDWSHNAKAVVSGSMDVFGELTDWNEVGAVAVIEQANLNLVDYSMHNDGPVRLGLNRQVIGIDQFRMLGDGSAIVLEGNVDLANDEVALTFDAGANLDILQGAFQGVSGSGLTDVHAEITGSVGYPVIAGQANVTNGRLRHFSLPHGLEAINGQLIFEPGSIRFDDIPAVMGSGPVTFSGRIGLEGLQLGDLEVSAVGEQMELRFPEGFRSVIDADLVLRGSPSAPVLAGVVNVRDAVLLDGFELSSGLFGGSEAVIPSDEEPAVPSPSSPLTFDVQILAPSSLRMMTNSARVVSSAELTWRGTYEQPVLFGSVELERGEAFIDGNRYRLNHGVVGFTNLTEIEPFVDIEVETDVRVPGRNYRVTVRASGTVDRLLPTLSSDPPLPEVDILSLLLGDLRDPQSADLRAARSPALAQQQRFQAGAARLLAGPLSSGVGRVVEDSFGVDTFQITPSLGPSSQQSAQFNPTARVLVGKRISDRAHVTLSHALSGANRDVIVVFEYDQSERLSWILSQNEDSTYALDFRVRHSF